MQNFVYPSGLAAAAAGAGNATAANQVLEIAQLTAINGKLPAVLGQGIMAGSLSVVIASDQSAIPITAATLPLPTGAATAANQATGNASLSSIDSKLTAPLSVTGPLTDTQLRASPVPVTLSGTQPVSGTVTANQGTAGASAWLVDGSGVTQPISAAALPLPSGASTSALQTSGNSSLSSIDSKTPALGQALAAASVPVVLTAAQLSTLTPLSTVAVTQSTSPWVTSASQSGTWNINNISGTISLPTGASTAAKQPALGTAGTASADVITVQGIAGMTAVKVDGSGSTQPVSGTVAVTQSTSPWVDNIAQINGVTPLMGNGVTGTGSQRVTIASDNTAFTVNAAQSGTWNINNISGTVSLPTGAATEASLVKLTLAQGSTTSGQTGALILGAVTTAAPSYTTGQSSPLSITLAGGLRVDGSAVTQPVSIAGTVTVSQGAFAFSNAPARNDYSSVNVTTAAFVQLVASTTSATKLVEVFDSSGQTLAFAVGAAASEVIQFYIFPGGNGQIPLAIPAGSRISVKAISATASVGEIDVNFYG